MEGAVLLQKSDITTSAHLLDNCVEAIAQGNLDDALNLCIQFLEAFPVDNAIQDSDSIAYHNYLRLCSVMMNDNHHYTAVMHLLSIKQTVIDFAYSFHIELGKKGVQYPTPVLQKEDVLFVFAFCNSFKQLILDKLQNRQEQ